MPQEEFYCITLSWITKVETQKRPVYNRPTGKLQKRKKEDKMMTCSGEQQTKDEKRKGLFLNQKKLLDTFLNNGAISQAQYEKSLGDLITKMKMEDVYDKMQKDGETE